MNESENKQQVEGPDRDRPPGEPRSWEKREGLSVASEKRWGRLAKTFVYSVWITLLVIAIVAVVLYVLFPPR
jgi:hypothetical protein